MKFTVNGIKISTEGGCEDVGCIRNYKGSCLHQRLHCGECEKHDTSKQSKKTEVE